MARRDGKARMPWSVKGVSTDARDLAKTATARDGSWDSGIIEAGSAWQTTVTPTMLGGYFCAFHPSMTASLARPAPPSPE